MTNWWRQCEEAGLVTRSADPTDARAKIVVFTRSGWNGSAPFDRPLSRLKPKCTKNSACCESMAWLRRAAL